MHCAFCQQPLGYVHGHAACLHGACPMFGVNQAECCAGERGDCVATSTAASTPVTQGAVTSKHLGKLAWGR